MAEPLRPRRVAGWPLLAAALLLCAAPVRAGLFDDEEARKAILDLRSRIQANDEAQRARLTELQQGNAQLLEQVQQLRRSLLDLNAQLEAQRGESARLRGVQEQLTRDLTDTQKRLQDASVALDQRLRVIEPQKVSVDGRDFLVPPEERRSYETAMAQLRTADFDKASTALAAFLQRYPYSEYGDSARFWLGNAQYGQKNYKDAIATFKAMVTAAPTHPRAPEAMLAMANSQAEMKDIRGARRTIDELVKAYPASEAAAAGKERLASLKG
jgi:tol-pal system protein YbgF